MVPLLPGHTATLPFLRPPCLDDFMSLGQ
jgi:hypothetical protein